MTKEVQMTIRIEPELRAEFTEAASRDHRPAAQVLRELMRGYIKQVGAKDRAPANDGIPVLDRFDREEAVKFGRASVALEGYKTSPELAVQQQQFSSSRESSSWAARQVAHIRCTQMVYI